MTRVHTQFSAFPSLTNALVIGLALLSSGCDGIGGGVAIEPEVSIKVDELDDEDVATLEGTEAGSVSLPVRSPSGAVIAPPETRSADLE